MSAEVFLMLSHFAKTKNYDILHSGTRSPMMNEHKPCSPWHFGVLSKQASKQGAPAARRAPFGHERKTSRRLGITSARSQSISRKAAQVAGIQTKAPSGVAGTPNTGRCCCQRFSRADGMHPRRCRRPCDSVCALCPYPHGHRYRHHHHQHHDCVF